MENSGREEDELFSVGSEDNRGDGLYDRMGRRTSDASDIVIIEDQSAKISEKKRGAAASSFEEEEKEMDQEEKEGDCTDCQKPMGDTDEHMNRNHRDLFISCKLCLQVDI